MDFACKQVSIEEVLKCSLGLTKAQLKVLRYLQGKDWLTAEDVAQKLKLDTSTVQRALKILTEKEVLDRIQENRGQGGYQFSYRCKGRETISALVMKSIKSWVARVEKELKS